MTRTGGYSRRGSGIKDMRSLIILGAIIAFTMGGCLFFDGSYKCFACESHGQTGQSNGQGEQSDSQGGSNGASAGSQNATSSVGKSSGVAQSGNRGHDGNGPSDFMLIDCENPLFESLLPCKQLSRIGNND